MECQPLGQIKITTEEFRNLRLDEFAEVLQEKTYTEFTNSGEAVCVRKSNCFVAYAQDIHAEFVQAMLSATINILFALRHCSSRTKFTLQYTLLTDLWDRQIECVAF
ncbi:hypothetical protein LCGC14_0645400 [marine sediment metagenome]|uniref:Uncharacterized protein n=1 Tax=marine sediment metagenome TaxID=412755 RepID=A0A0F9R356_9ZZZZ